MGRNSQESDGSRRKGTEMVKTAKIRLLLSLFLVLVAVTLLASPALATDITVDTTEDETNFDGDCSLREAIIAANTDAVAGACPAGSGTDTIAVPAGTYTLSINGANEDAAMTGRSEERRVGKEGRSRWSPDH